MKKQLIIGLGIAGLVAVVAACSDPPPPSLGHVGIQSVYDNTGKTAITYVVRDAATCSGLEGDIAVGLTVGDGITLAISLSRTINDPPEKDADTQALLDKPFTFAVTGDAFTIAKAKEFDRVIINTVHPGDGTLVISVAGLGGNFSMPIHVVDQGVVPPNVYKDKDCVPDSGAPADAGSEATTTDTDAGNDAG